ncbi:WGR domain-containing protein [Wenyingzhuangia sp. IMCC45574]
MKLINTLVLYFKDQKSDKVYEVDLCEVDDDLFVVNFRYGRRGNKLREGTKTVFPVTSEEAQKIFDKLVSEKKKKGYSETEVETIAETGSSQNRSIRDETILKYLEEAKKGIYSRDWKVSKIILRAGVLNLREAADIIAYFLNSKNDFEAYAAVKALAQFENYTYSKEIYNLFKEKGFQDKTGRIAISYLLKNKDLKDANIPKIFQEVQNLIPTVLTQYLNDVEKLKSKIFELHLSGKKLAPTSLYYLYLYSFYNEHLRVPIYEVLKSIPLKVNTFKSVRYIYRTAEVVEDYSFLALLSKQISIKAPGYQGEYQYINGEYILASQAMKKANPGIAFSKKTKRYFNNQTYKSILDLSTKNEKYYINFASEILCSLDDDIDQEKEINEGTYVYDYDSDNYSFINRFFPPYASFSSLMFILYGNSERFSRTQTKWYYEQPLDSNKELYQEATLSEAWSKYPESIIKILIRSKSKIGLDFALSIVNANPELLEHFSSENLLDLLHQKDNRVINLALTCLKERYSNKTPEKKIILALLTTNHIEASTIGLDWLTTYQDDLLDDKSFFISLINTKNNEVIYFLKEIFNDSIKYKHTLEIDDLERVLNSKKQTSEEFLIIFADLITQSKFGELFKSIDPKKLQELIQQPLFSNKLIGAALSKVNKTSTIEIIGDFILEYLNSENSHLRKIGIDLLETFPESYLIAHQKNILDYCFSSFAEVRTAIQPTIKKLIEKDELFGRGLLSKLLQNILNEEEYEGIHETSYQNLIINYKEELSSLAVEDILQLVLSKYEFAQKLGTSLFKEKITLKELSIVQLISLLDSDVKEIRDLIKIYFESDTKRANYETEEFLKVFNTQWIDTKSWAFDFIEKHITANNWSLDLMLFLCDHVDEEVQSFGRKILVKHFNSEEGVDVLLKLQEHPSKTMHFFVTNYLDTYAKNNPTIILELKHFFKTVLFSLNTNRVAKSRVYNFLEAEAIKDTQVAEMTIDLMDSIIGSKSITYTSKCIDILLIIGEKYPHLEIPITINQISQHEVQS